VQERNGTISPVNAARTMPWPEGVLARYLTVAGATVDIHQGADGYTSARCTGCPIGYTGDEMTAHDRAQQHAEKCRALPRPPATA
jgi:hypothetical protein